MTADQFLVWAEQQSERYELVGGEVVAMSPERAVHSETKSLVWLALRTASNERGLPCQAFADGMAVRVDARTVYEPDAMLRCGPRLPPDAVEVTDPLIVVEVVSPSSRSRDGAKLEDYFRVSSVRHYLIVKTDTRSVIHHRRDDTGSIRTAILRHGAVQLDPPGIELQIASLFESGP
ncbi:MAG: Uma2 family endonuclease [Geminicoccaceae bacterium]